MSTGGFSESTSSIDLHQAWIEAARLEAGRIRHSLRRSEPPGSEPADLELLRALSKSMPAYEIEEIVGRGGQGLVVRAVQRATRRAVAIKVLRGGPLAGDRERMRFEREVRILAQLKHPNIVTIHDSGYVAGLHYYVMDYIRGDSLLDFVRRTGMPIRARLELLALVCDAIHVAHLRGVIHRDLKPGNIRVDQSGQPHILDFGLAKVDECDVLADSNVEHRTLTGQFVGSLPWAAPEQISGRPDNLDLRTDVYSLGVIFYQLLTERFPCDVDVGFREAMENICRQDPKPPSAYASGVGDEVDQIVLKCLRKDPDGRYDAAGSVAREIRRYLAGEPVEAKRDSSWYLLRKTIRRHRVSAVISGLVVLVIVTAAAGLAVLYEQERQAGSRERDLRESAQAAEKRAIEAQREAEKQSRIKEAVNRFFAGDVLAAASPDRLGREATIVQALDAGEGIVERDFAEDPLVAAEILFTMGATHFRLGNIDRAERNLVAAVERYRKVFGDDSEEYLSVRFDLAGVYLNTGKFTSAEGIYLDILERRRRSLGPAHVDTARVESNLGWLYVRMGRMEDAEPLLKHALEVNRRELGEQHEETLTAMSNLAMLYMETGRLEDAEPMMRAEYDASRRLLGEEHSGTLISMGNLAVLYQRLNRYDEAQELFERGLAARRRKLGPGHPSTLLQANNLAILYGKRQDYGRSSALLENALKAGRDHQSESHPTVISIMSNLGAVYDRMNRHAEAEPLHVAALKGGLDYLDADHTLVGLYQSRLGICLTALERYDAAEPLLRAGYETLNKSPDEASTALEAAQALAELLDATGRADEAKSWRRKGAVPTPTGMSSDD